MSFVFAEITVMPCFKYPSKCGVAVDGGYDLLNQHYHAPSLKASNGPFLEGCLDLVYPLGCYGCVVTLLGKGQETLPFCYGGSRTSLTFPTCSSCN